MVIRKGLMPVPSSVDLVPTTGVQDDRDLAREVLGKIHGHPGLNVGTLVVHRCRGGLCVEGHIQLIDPTVNLAELLSQIETVTPILNRVMVSTPMNSDSTVGT